MYAFMKTPLLLSLFLGLLTPVFSQIHFEEIQPPVDFNLSEVRKGPTGERFVQAYNKPWSIYTSFDAETWEEAVLPGSFLMEDMRFFADGTPLFLTRNNGAHLIRREGEWHSMSLPGAFQEDINASFIREDSLFVYQDGRMAYSLDKGSSFEKLFELPAGMAENSLGLWKLGGYFVLRHVAGVRDSLSVFDGEGRRVLQVEMELGNYESVYNGCGQVLFISSGTYYRLEEAGLVLESGPSTDFLTGYEDRPGTTVLSQNGRYYCKQAEIVYRSSPCGGAWEVVLNDSLVGRRAFFWVDEEGQFYFYKRNSDAYTLYDTDTEAFSEQELSIDQSYTISVDESQTEQQTAITANQLFAKDLEASDWSEMEGGRPVETAYGPDGRLYARFANGQTLLSEDNGDTFTAISAPQTTLSSFLEVPEDEVVILVDELMVRAHYTLDQGQSWVSVQLGIGGGGGHQRPAIRKSGDYIYVMRGSQNPLLHRINTLDGTIETAFFDGLIAASQADRPWAILEDGAVYLWAAGMGNPPGLYRYSWEQGLEYLASEENLGGSYALLAAGNRLFGLVGDRIFRYEDGAFVEFEVTGLPEVFYDKDYQLSDSGHLYAIVDDHFIFRSTLPLEGLIPTSTHRLKPRQQVAVYPNPATQTLFLDLSLDELRQVEQVEILDPLGRLAQSWQRPDGIRLDISGLQPGVYYLRLRRNGRIRGHAAFVKR